MSTLRSLLFGAAAVVLSSGYLASSAALASSIPVIPHEKHQNDPEPDVQETGVITAVNQDSHQITLANGHSFKVPGWISFDHLAKGALISITYTPNPHHNTADVKTISVI